VWVAGVSLQDGQGRMMTCPVVDIEGGKQVLSLVFNRDSLATKVILLYLFLLFEITET